MDAWLVRNALRPLQHTLLDGAERVAIGIGAVDVGEFGNLGLLTQWAHESGVDLDATFCDFQRCDKVTSLLGTKNGTPETYRTLSKRQNATWARKLVVEGVALQQEKKLDAAIKKYSDALEIDAECVDALVARGAALANLGNFDKAIADHSRALEIEPSHVNADRYLQKCISRKKEIEAEKQSAMDGAFLMPLDIPQRTSKIPLTKQLMHSDPHAPIRPPKNPPPPPNALMSSSQLRNNSTSSLASASTSHELNQQRSEEYGFVFDDTFDTVAPPPPPTSSSKKRKKEKKSGSKKKEKKRSKEKKRDKKRRRRSDSEDSRKGDSSDGSSASE